MLCHSGDGYLTLAGGEELITLNCHWPFDLAMDEWINIENSFSTLDYLKAINDARATGKGTARGINGGFMEVALQADGFTIEFSRPQAGWFATSLQLHIQRPVDDLLLQVPRPRLAAEAAR
jgi:hypothetical protein